MVHAGTTTDAAQHVFHVAADELGAAGIDEHDVHLLGPIGFAAGFHAGSQRQIVGNRLADGRARQQANERRKIFHRRNDFFNPRHHAMNTRQRRDQIGVALIGDGECGAGFGDDKIGA